MLGAHAREYRVIGFYQGAQFGDVPLLSRAHLGDKRLFAFKIRAEHRPGDAHRRVVGFGRNHRPETPRKDAFEDVLDGGLAVAAHDRDAENFALAQYLPRPFYIFPIARFLVKPV